MILGYTMSAVFAFIVPFFKALDFSDVQGYQAKTAWPFIGSVCDLYLTCMLWFILDSQKLPAIFKDRHYSYAAMDVIKANASFAVLDSSFEVKKNPMTMNSIGSMNQPISV